MKHTTSETEENKSKDYKLGYECGISRKPYDKNRDGAVQWWEYNRGYRDGWQDSHQPITA